MNKKRVAILGSTGSIGKSALNVLRNLTNQFEVVLLGANNNYKLLASQANEFKVKKLFLNNDKFLNNLKLELNYDAQVYSTQDFLIESMQANDIDIVICATVGVNGLLPTITALKSGKKVALATKEIMVSAGDYINNLLKTCDGEIIPVDSEHSAIYQCLVNRNHQDIKKLILTSSGGAFRNYERKELEKCTISEALNHPVWSMGKKITVDSASMMNKALEVIEAKYLFNIPEKQIQVLIHPEVIIHSMVEFKDNSIIAMLSQASMELPIQYALTAPNYEVSNIAEVDFIKLKTFSFEELDENIFPSIKFARHAINIGGTMPTILNAANEVAVAKFMNNQISFTKIWDIIEKTMENSTPLAQDNLDNIIKSDLLAREFANKL